MWARQSNTKLQFSVVVTTASSSDRATMRLHDGVIAYLSAIHINNNAFPLVRRISTISSRQEDKGQNVNSLRAESRTQLLREVVEGV